MINICDVLGILFNLITAIIMVTNDGSYRVDVINL